MSNRRPWNSLHARLLVGAVLWIGIALTVSDLAISSLFRQHVTTQFLHELTDHLGELQGVAQIHDGPAISVVRPLSDPRFEAPASGYYWQISSDGRVLIKSPSLGADMIRIAPGRAPLDPYVSRLLGAPAPILLTEWDVRTPFHLRYSVGADVAQLDAVLDRFNQLLRNSLAVIAAGLIGAALVQVALGLRPMSRLRQSLSQVRTGRIERLPETFPNEVLPLVSELNSLIGANQERVVKARAQAGNLAHALKGPLAILADEAQRLTASGNAAGAVVLQQCVTMSRQIDYQIARARAAATRGGAGRLTRVAEVVGTTIAAMARLHGDRTLAFENDLDASLEAACDPEDLSEMVGNLIDNAAKWAVRRVRIRGGAPQPEWVTIVVEDDGPGIASESRDSVFGVGKRLDEQKPGSGLGLAIVKDLAQLYGGDVRLGESDLGGLSATIRLPAAGGAVTQQPNS